MSGENENGFDSTSSRTRKRMLPSVAEIARELSRRTGADAASILTTSRKVCAEELVRIKEGQESVPVDILVERARALLEPEAHQAAGTFAFEPPPPLPDAPLPVPAVPLAEGADPFAETMGKLDLRWEDDGMESPHGHGEEIPPAPQPSPFEMSFQLPDEAPGSGPDAGPRPVSPPPLAFNREEPFAPEPVAAPEPAAAPAIPLQPPPARRPKLPFFLAIALLILAAGGAAWFFLVGPSKAAGPPPPLAVKDEPEAAPAETPAKTASPADQPSSSQPSVPSPADQSPEGAAASAAAQLAPTAPSAPTAPAASIAPEPVPVEPKAKPAPAAPAAEVPKPAAEKAAPSPRKGEKAPPSAIQVQVRAGTLVTPDWTAAPVHVVHFSSFQEKPRAEKHAAVLAKELGLPARAVQVDLGDKGLWYRAVVGEFPTADEALALRNQLLEKGTPGVGLVYRMTPKK